MTQVSDKVRNEDINFVMNKICDAFLNAATNSFSIRNNKIRKGEGNSKPLFNKSCNTARLEFIFAKKTNNKSDLRNPLSEQKAKNTRDL